MTMKSSHEIVSEWCRDASSFELESLVELALRHAPEPVAEWGEGWRLLEPGEQLKQDDEQWHIDNQRWEALPNFVTYSNDGTVPFRRRMTSPWKPADKNGLMPCSSGLIYSECGKWLIARSSLPPVPADEPEPVAADDRAEFDAWLRTAAPDNYDASIDDAWHVWQAARKTRTKAAP